MNKVVKANELTEKIYLERILCSNEVYDIWKSQKTISDDIEYIRKDAFIEKACEFISLNAADYIDVTHKGGIEHLALQERFIDEFRKYMEGE